jgi:exo-1,4-beta-D-glucosaminidase
MNSILKRRLLLAFALILCAVAPAFAQQNKWMVQNIELKNKWKIQSSEKIAAGGKEISSANTNTQNWYPALVPGSVLGSLVADSVYKNIFFGRNLEKIPSAQFDVPWWYRTTFTIPEIHQGQISRLQFNGINYRAEIWLNGQKVASSDTLAGGYCRFNIDISKEIKAGNNVLAVKVFRPMPAEPTLGFVDWNPAPPDHNMGIWRDVRLQLSGPVAIVQPFVQTKVDTATLKHADLLVSTVLRNYSDKPVKGELKGLIGKEISFSKTVTLSPNSSTEVQFTSSEYSQLSIDNPRLWWVHTLGTPELYDLQLQFLAGGKISDKDTTRFGIRSVSDYVTTEGHRGYKLNGKKILIKGGGWTDPMLLNATPEYERAGIDYAVHMNLNTLRMEDFWGSNEHLYDLCDEKGILIMVGWSAHWEWAPYFGGPVDKFGGIKTREQMDVVARSWKDQIVWLINHPSVFLWVYGSDKLPRPELEKRYLEIHKKYDPTRPFAGSAQEHTSSLTGPTRMKMRGPYDYVPPDYWYIDTAYGGAFGFNTETGPGPQVPVLESLKKMIPADSLWPIGSAWKYHSARGKFHNLNNYTNAMDKRLGEATDLNDYLRKAQYLNYEGMRAMFEAFIANRFKSTGIIQWMYNSSWPKVWWQLYDYYLMPTGAFYGARIANEPLHISYNYGNNGIDVSNNTSENAGGLSAEVHVLDLDMKSLFKQTIPLASLSERQTNTIFTLPSDLQLSKTWFLDLRLFDKQHKLISTNFYVLSTQKDSLNFAKSEWYITPQSAYADLTGLQDLPKVKLEQTETMTKKGNDTYVDVKLKNPSEHLAFMVYLDMKKKGSNESVVPVFWDENYITLLPGEERSVSGYCHTADLEGNDSEIIISGWNIE